MTDFWKSQAKKHCDVCNCWLSDQKASRELHEQGKRHQENVQRRLSEARKKTKDQETAQRQQSSVIQAMERAAAASMLKDIRENPEMRGKFGLSPEEEQALVRKAGDDTAKREKEAERDAEKQRISAFIGEKLKSNTQSAATAVEQSAGEPDGDQTVKSSSEPATSSKTKIKFRTPKAASQESSTAQAHPFGAWVPAVNAATVSKPEAPTVDLQLPTASGIQSMHSRLRDAQGVKAALMHADNLERVAMIESGVKRVASSTGQSTSSGDGPVAFKRARSHVDQLQGDRKL